MADSTSNGRTAGRIGAAALLILALVFGLGGATIDYAFASDPLGPRVFPVVLASALAVLALLYWRSPGVAETFPRGSHLLRTLAVPSLVLLSALLLDPAGFPVSVFVLTAGVAWIFGAPPRLALLSGAGHALLWWVVFVRLLSVYLPVGWLFA
ncbi:tripartite tricarboxylate transporter TctB family protein [Nordella sp. HKS 07]|uniref:tripartite tricarboxylate transporter TctB family protein n=1 Tax=Nordella sp. HKS 07 TaxID=2712222 RepID=UPI0013E171DF|nr:tripartite tricarboxylate transporter TctB family protein [Nordella sp. HKS 07]QIG50938.1 tripartite tricarboxylate transporter TctB family protein [Nordella sp. HKS 07]